MAENKKKVLLMGSRAAGKTSMRSIIFANYIARDTASLSPTSKLINSPNKKTSILIYQGSRCGVITIAVPGLTKRVGYRQDAFVDNYLNNQREHIFSNVSVLIFVFDVESRDLQKDMQYFTAAMKAMQQFSSDARIFCLIHKMDLVPEESGERIFRNREAELNRIALPMKVTCFKTSIWDETLYLAWSSIVYSLIPNVSMLEQQLDRFCQVCEADEVVLFERATFLVISHASTKEHEDVHRFEKISNIIKQFKLSCTKGFSQFQSMEVRNSQFTAFIDLLTSNTYVMVIMSDSTIQASAININIKAARKFFEMFFQQP